MRPAGEHGPHAKLRHGEFFGQSRHEAEVRGLSLAHIRADPRTDVQRHTHEAAHFILVTHGLYVSAASGAASDPVLIYNPPGTTHRDRFRRSPDGRFDGRFLSISIAPDRMKAIADGVTLTERATSVAGPQALALAAKLIGELARWEPASGLAAEGICLELMGCVARRELPHEMRSPPWLTIARDMLRERGAALSVGEIAAECGVHPVHLARTFRRFFGCSPRAYLHQCRLERATALLRRKSLSLTEVALRSGFADQSHMTHAFQSAFAVTPGAYRRSLGAGNDVSCEQDGARELS